VDAGKFLVIVVMPNAEHICLLSEVEIADLYARPVFNGAIDSRDGALA
jgi:hypothetical protein